MSETTMAIVSERWLDTVVLQATVNDIDGDRDDTWLLPAQMSDVAIMEVVADAETLATIRVNMELAGARLVVINQANKVVDFVGITRWSIIRVADASAYWSPDPLVLWRQGEKLALRFPELDINVTPTGDLRLTVKAVRVKVLQPLPETIQLVRPREFIPGL